LCTKGNLWGNLRSAKDARNVSSAEKTKIYKSYGVEPSKG